MTVSKLEIAITTCNEAGRAAYLQDTVRSLGLPLEDGTPVRFVLDARGRALAIAQDVRQLCAEHEYRIEAIPNLRTDRRERIFLATTQALVGASGQRDLLLCQDDVQMTAGWRDKLEALVLVARRRRSDDRWAIALWSAYPWQQSYDGLCDYPPPKFYGTVCMLFSAALVQPLRDWMARLSDAPPASDDMAVKQFFTTFHLHCHLFAAVPSLAQHVGNESTGGDAPERTSPTFRP